LDSLTIASRVGRFARASAVGVSGRVELCCPYVGERRKRSSQVVEKKYFFM